MSPKTAFWIKKGFLARILRATPQKKKEQAPEEMAFAATPCLPSFDSRNQNPLTKALQRGWGGEAASRFFSFFFFFFSFNPNLILFSFPTEPKTKEEYYRVGDRSDTKVYGLYYLGCALPSANHLPPHPPR